MGKRTMLAFLMVTALLTGLTGGAQAWYTAESQMGWLSGYAQTVTGYTDLGTGLVLAESKVYVPLNQPLIGIRFTTPAFRTWLMRAEAWTKLGGGSGRSRVDNWDLTGVEPELVLYADADSQLSGAMVGDVSLVSPARAVGPLNLSVVAGWRQEKFDFAGFDGEQVGFGAFAGETRTFDGLCMKYSAVYDLPYFGLTAPFAAGKLGGRLEFTWAPQMGTHDSFTGSVATSGTGSGTAVLGRAEAVYPLKEGLELSGHLSYALRTANGTEERAKVEADGSHTYLGTFTEKLRSEQYLAGLTLRQRF